MPNLNEQQQALVDFLLNGVGSGNVVARAGCGKTFALVNGAVKTIVENKLGSCAIMAFNKAAATEFEHRIEALAEECNNNDFYSVDAGTVHSFGFAAWRKVAGKVKVDGFKVANIIKELNNGYYDFLPQVQKLVSLAKQHAYAPDASSVVFEELIAHFDIDANGSSNEIISMAAKVLEANNKQRDVIDFDDMIYLPVIFDVKVDQYDFVLIDEAQDTNAARRMLAFKMMKPNARLIAVGDDKQAIYGFTGADSDSMEIIKRSLNSIELPLTITYRCPKAVVAEANRLVPDLQAHESAPSGVVREIGTFDFLPPLDKENMRHWFIAENVTANDVALCRNTKPLVETAYTFFRLGKACRVEGRDIGEGLIQLATKWKRIVTLGALMDKLDEYQASEVEKWSAKNNAFKVQTIEDKCETLRVIASHLLDEGKDSVNDLKSHIRSMFGDTPEGEQPKVFTLSTIHKSKGREWNRVYILRRDLIPSRYAKQDWQLEQEYNLEYVAITRAKSELVYVQ